MASIWPSPGEVERVKLERDCVGCQASCPHAQDHLKGSLSSGLPSLHPSVLPQPHLHSYKEAFEEMEGTSPSSPPPSGGKSTCQTSSSPSSVLFFLGLCGCPRYGVGGERVSGGGKGWNPLLLTPRLTRLYCAVFSAVCSQPKDEPGSDLASRLLDYRSWLSSHGAFCVD